MLFLGKIYDFFFFFFEGEMSECYSERDFDGRIKKSEIILRGKKFQTYLCWKNIAYGIFKELFLVKFWSECFCEVESSISYSGDGIIWCLSLFLHRPLSSLVNVAAAQRNIPEYFLITLDEGIKPFSCFTGLTGNGVGVRKNLVGTLRLPKTAFYQFRLEFLGQLIPFPSGDVVKSFAICVVVGY